MPPPKNETKPALRKGQTAPAARLGETAATSTTMRGNIVADASTMATEQPRVMAG
jgi:hypothetical protein